MTLTLPTPVDNQTGKLLAAIGTGTLSFDLGTNWTGPSVSPPNYVRIIIDPSLIGIPNALYEVVYGNVTSGNSTFTCLAGAWGNGRGVEGSSAQNHAALANWDCGATAADLTALPNLYQARLFGTATCGANANVENVVGLENIDYDNSPGATMAVSGVQNGSATGHILIPIPGIYAVKWCVAWAVGTLGIHRSSINVNPSFSTGAIISSSPTRQGNRSNDTDIGRSVGSDDFKLAATDQVFLGCFQGITNGAGINADSASFLSVSLIRAL